MLFLGAGVFVGSVAMMLALVGKTSKGAVRETEKEFGEDGGNPSR
jgi:hypothetical protein